MKNNEILGLAEIGLGLGLELSAAMPLPVLELLKIGAGLVLIADGIHRE